MFTVLKRTWKGSSREISCISNLWKSLPSRQVAGFATIPSSFRIGSHINNLEDPSVPFVLIETSFLSKFNNDTSKFRLLQYLEKVIKSQGAVPISLGMINGNIIMGLNKEEAKTLCFSNKKMLCCDRSTISQYCTQNTTAFISPSAAIHISNMYHIPLVLSGEIACLGHSNDKAIHQDVAFLHECSSIIISPGFHPFQDLQKSVDYLESQHIGVYTLNSNTIPSCFGSKTSFPSPHSFDDEGKLLTQLKDARQRKESSIVFSGTTTQLSQDSLHDQLREANKIACQKVAPINRYRYIEKLLFNDSKVDMKTILYKSMERNAILASKIALSLSNPCKVVPQPVHEVNENPLSYTYSIYNICKQKHMRNDLLVLLSVMEVIKNTMSLPNNNVQREIDKTIDSLVESKLKYSGDNISIWKQEIRKIEHPKPFLPSLPSTRSFLPRPKEGSPIFITSDCLLTQYQEVSPTTVTMLPSSISGHSYLLYEIFTSLTRETPPLHISIRGADETATKMTELARMIGDAEYGTTFVNDAKTAQVSEFYDVKGNLIKRIMDDVLFYQVNSEYVKKYEQMLIKAPILVADGQMNRSVSAYLTSIIKTRGIPLFLDCSETRLFRHLIDTGILSCSSWIVLNENSIESLLVELNEGNVAKEWHDLMNLKSMRCEELKNKIEEIMIVLKKQLIKNASVNVLLSLQNCGQWVTSMNNNSLSMIWMKSDGPIDSYSNVAFESGFLWGILNQYPLDLSISLGQITQQQVHDSQTLFGKAIHKSCFANQIVKYMTGINSFDIFSSVFWNQTNHTKIIQSFSSCHPSLLFSSSHVSHSSFPSFPRFLSLHSFLQLFPKYDPLNQTIYFIKSMRRQNRQNQLLPKSFHLLDMDSHGNRLECLNCIIRIMLIGKNTCINIIIKVIIIVVI